MRTLAQSRRQWRRHRQGWGSGIGLGLLHQDYAHCRLWPVEFPRVRPGTALIAAQSAVAAASLALATAALAQPTVTCSVPSPAAAPGHAVLRSVSL